MWVNKRSPRNNYIRFNSKEDGPVQKHFQWKYTAIMAGFIILAVLITVAPLMYFLHENYAIFIKLAYERAPQLVEHLEQEKGWLQGYLLVALVTIIAFCYTFSMKMTAKLIGPLLILQSHIKTITRGNWSIDEVRTRNKDEFNDLIASYNYFYYCLKQVTQSDIEKLQKLKITSQNREAYNIWKKMIEDKSERLGMKPFISDASDSTKSHDSRHAS